MSTTTSNSTSTSTDTQSLVKRTIQEYFDVNDNNSVGDDVITREQHRQLTKFLSSATGASTQLIIERSDDSPNQIQFHIRDIDDQKTRKAPPVGRLQRSDSTLVFVKLAAGSEQTGDDGSPTVNDTEVVGRLRNLVHRMDGSPAGLMHALSELRRQAKNDQILAALVGERQDLVAKVNDWADQCADTSEVDTGDDIVARISFLKAREGKLRAVVRVCDTLFVDLDLYRQSKPTLEQIYRELGDESAKMFREWYQSMRDVKLDAGRQCIEIDTSSQVPRVTFDPKMVKLAADASVLRCLGFAIPADVLAAESDVKKYGSYARELREIVNFYCSVADQILLSQRPMLIAAAKRFTALLEARDRISWSDDPNRLAVWLDELKQFSKQFASENRLLRKQHQKILAVVRNLFDIPVPKWRPLVNDVRTMIQEIDYGYQNTVPWKRHWDHQLYKILEYHFNGTLLKSDNLLSFGSSQTNSTGSSSSVYNKNLFRPFTANSSSMSLGSATGAEQLKIELCFIGGSVTYRPPLEELKAKIYGRIKQFLLMPEKFEGFAPLHTAGTASNASTGVQTDTKSLFYAIYLRNFNSFAILYEKAEEIVNELIKIRQQFVDWCSLYYVIKWHNTSASGTLTTGAADDNNNDNNGAEKQPQTLAEFLGCDMLDDYRNNLILIKSKAQRFNKEFADNEISCQSGNLWINILPIKSFVEWLLSEADKLLVWSLKDRCDKEIRVIEDKCGQLLAMASKRPENIDDLLNVDRLFKTELTGVQQELNDRYGELESKLAFLMKWSSKIAPDLSDVRQRFDEFERVIETKDSLLESYKDIVKSQMGAELANIGVDVQSFINRWQSMSADMRENKETISIVKIESDSLAERCTELAKSCDYFGQQKPRVFELFATVADEVRETDAKWNLIHEFESGLGKYTDMEWIVSRNKLSAIEAYISQWVDDNPGAGPMLDNRVKEWRELVSILKLCRGECFVKSHWQEFLALVGLTIDYEKLKLADLVKQRRQLVVTRDAIRELNTKASNEMSIRETFNELDLFATSAVLVLYDHQTSDPGVNLSVKLIRDWRQILNQVSECSLTLQTVKNAEFFTNDLVERCSLWESRLNQLDSVLALMNAVQRKWISLEPIYAKDDTGMFTDYTFTPASRDFQEILKVVAKDAHVMRLLHIPGLETRLQTIDRTLTACQKKLQTFMEESRARFPRFYFLADDDLLLILAGKVEVNQSTLLKKLFNNTVCRIHLDGDNKSVVSVESPEGEVVPLRHPVVIESNRGASGVELWLRNLETQLKTSLKELFFDGLSQSEVMMSSSNSGSGGHHVWELPAQLLSLVNWVLFTQRVEEGIRRHSIPELKVDFEKELISLTTGQDMDVGGSSNVDTSVLAIKIKSLILDTIHFLSVMDELMDTNIRDPEDWVWQRQLRFYANKRRTNGLLTVQMGNSSFEYSFEYLGCFGGSKLVHTPLTDKCYLTLTQAMEMGLGGNPYGPAGTGKTESVKALGQHLGRQVMVFNCDEAIDVKAMTRILVGLIKCGAWGCFDEFNRLQLDVLSALSSQIQAIQWAIKNKSKSVLLNEYGEVDINTFTAIFITLNPAGKQYGGRNRLPDNLKSLFLPIAMSVPDNEIISKVLLLAEGFGLVSSQTLGQKLTIWFELARDCMTHQRHYDWGLRAIKTCLEASGRALRETTSVSGQEAKASGSSGGGGVDDREVDLVTNTLRQQIKSKLIDEDVDKFESLLVDVFGERAAASEAGGGTGGRNQLTKCIIKVIEEKRLVLDEVQMTKIVELDEQLRSRLGVVIVGQSGAGKSTLWKVLKDARRLVDMNSANNNNNTTTTTTTTTTVIINPKAVPRTELLGYVDDETREWHDGLLTHKSREIARDESTSGQFWLLFDGDIDPDWVEALNSVLDDNRILTLPTGERIDFDPKRCNLLFEVTSLEFASPATISRLGVVCVNGLKAPELLTSGLRQLDVRVSADELQRYVDAGDQRLAISLTRTLLSHIEYAKHEDTDPIKGVLRVQRNLPLMDASMKVKSGQFIQTPTVQKAVELVKPWIDDSGGGGSTGGGHVLFTGRKGCGKTALAAHTVLSTGSVVTINCTPDTSSTHIVNALKSSCTMSTSGSSRVMRSATNNKICIFVKNMDLLTADKWATKSVVAFLTQLITYGGLYDNVSHDWIQMTRFQVVATCAHYSCLDTRLVSLMHVVEVDLPPAPELETIFMAKMPNNCPYGQLFVKSFGRICHSSELQTYNEETPIDWLRVGAEIIDSLNYYSDVDNSVMRYEFGRALGSQMTVDPNTCGQNILNSALTSVFGTAADKSIVYVSLNGTAKLTAQTSDQFVGHIKRTVSSLVNETEIQDPQLAIIPETIALFAECTTFLKDANNDDKLVKGLVLLGSSGSGRKLAVRAISHAFGYDTVWWPKQAYNEKQLSSELTTLLTGGSGSASDEDRGTGDRKVLIIVDEIHLKLTTHLRDSIYRMLSESNSRSIVRVVLVLNKYNAIAEQMWGRVCHIHTCPMWSSGSLVQFPQLLIPDIVGNNNNTGGGDQELAKKFYTIYNLFAKQLVAEKQESRKYMAFLRIVEQIYVDKSVEIEKRREHLRTGVAKLEDASTEVEKLRAEATEQRELLAVKRQEADDALNLITNSMHGAEDQKVELEEIRERTERETQKLQVRKVEIDAELRQIEPVLQQAKQAVGAIRSESLSEIRSLRAPPEVIRDILEGVLRLMGVNDTSWVSMKSFLSRRGVKDEIMNFESRKITPDMRVKVETLLHNHSDSFEPSAAKRASVAAAPLAEWVKANVSFSRVLHKIRPLEDEQNRLESGLRSAQTRMKSLSNQLEGVETEVGALRNRLNQVTIEAAQIEVGLKQTNQTLTQSERLIDGLSGEFTRWKQQLRDIDDSVRALPEQALIAGAYIIFCSGEPSRERRRQLLTSLCSAIGIPEFDLLAFLDCPAEDDVFVRVGSPAHVTPFIYDPSRKALATSFDGHGSNYEVTDMRSRDWVKVLELSLRFGRTLVINDFQRIEYPLLPVLRHEVYGSAETRNWIFIGDKRVDYNRNFRLYLIGQDISTGTAMEPLFNLVNLSPSSSGMSSALLSLVIQCRRPELEVKKLEIEKEKLRLEAELRDLESKLLAKLMESTGNILNNTELIASLQELKQSALQVEQSLRESARVADDLHRERAEYDVLAQFASQVYFLVRELVTLNPMYRFGVVEYETIFQESLLNHKELGPNQLLQDVYNYVSRGLFPEDKIIFERFVRKRCTKESQTLHSDADNMNVRQFVRHVYGADKRVALIMTTPGSDPTGEVAQVAAELGIRNPTIMSMASDVIGRAERAVTSGGTGAGNDDSIELLCLTNLHLVIGWLPVLTHLLMSDTHSNSNNNRTIHGSTAPKTTTTTSTTTGKSSKLFVILCTERCDEFPISLLEMSVKFAYESAPGLQHQLKRLTMDSGATKSIPELQILSYLHAICCERRHFVPQGWTKPYEFGFADFRSASNVIQTVIEAKDRRLRMDFIRGLLGTVIYGGKLDTSVDDGILQALINRWFTPNRNSRDVMDPSDEISVLGLARNVNKLRQTAQEFRLTKGLHVLEKATDADKSEAEFEKLRSLAGQLATYRDRQSRRPSIQNTGKNVAPIDVYIGVECSQSQQLIRQIDNDINDTDSQRRRQTIGNQLVNNETPDTWLDFWPNGPLSADTFIKCTASMCKEIVKLREIADSGMASSSSTRDMEFNLAHLFYPNSLVNALKQQASRRLKTSVDQLRLYSAWGRHTLSTGSLTMRCSLAGIVIEGAVFDGQQLQDCQTDSPLQSDMPALSIYFLSKDSAEPYDRSQVIRLPLYGNSRRETIVEHLDVPIERGTDQHWTECAVSLVIKYNVA